MQQKPLRWSKRALKDARKFPPPVQERLASLLDDICCGETPAAAKPMHGFGGGATVMEIVQDYRTDAYRAFYTAKIGPTVYVLHCIQKKSKSGIGLTQQDKETIARRLKVARAQVARAQVAQQEVKDDG